MLALAIQDKLDTLPSRPGVYLFKDTAAQVVYVGKAKSLRARVRSYFQAGASDERYFIAELPRVLGDIDVIVTRTEKEAAILENTLIKQHRPRFNVKLRDDKEYLSLRLDTTHAWPRLEVVRRPRADGARYFGPYHSATAARRTLHLINKHFQLRTCRDTEFERRVRPCLQYQIKRCPAPCVYEVDHAFYAEQVDTVARFLHGRYDELERGLVARMGAAARDLRFELAAVYRDQLRAIEKVREGQRVVSHDSLDRDVLGLHREGDRAELALVLIRAGKLHDVLTFSLRRCEVPDEEVVGAFVAQHYAGLGWDGADGEVIGAVLPDEILLPCEPEGVEGMAELLSERAGSKVAVLAPKRGPKFELVALATDNARHALHEKRVQKEEIEVRLGEMQERLRLPTLPRRIECCDISHLAGGDTFGAIVAMMDGELDKKRYRTFRVRGREGAGAGGDDYAAMREVLSRRFRRGAESEGGNEEGWSLPDLFVVDGGRGQLGVALAAAGDLGLHELPIVGLAKERENVQGDKVVDRVYLPGQKNPVTLRSHASALVFLARLRDEAHRVSNRARERSGTARRLRSELDDVRGLGRAASKALLKAFGSVDAIRTASDDALLEVNGIQRRHVAALRRAWAPTSALLRPPHGTAEQDSPANDEPPPANPVGGK